MGNPEKATTALDDPCDQAVQTGRARLRQVLCMTCRSRSKRNITEKLYLPYLSENTAKYRTKQIYKKLDFPGEQELLTKIGVK
jgi:DNA-binding NarL/FixJ family response regulator